MGNTFPFQRLRSDGGAIREGLPTGSGGHAPGRELVRKAALRYDAPRQGCHWGATVDGSLNDGIGVLAAIAAGADDAAAIASRLGVDAGSVADHLDRLSDAGFVHRDGERVTLAERVTRLLDGLVGRSDLLGIAAPVVLEAERRLGVHIDVDIVDQLDPTAISGSSPFAVVGAASGGRDILVPVLDVAGQVACVLRLSVAGTAPEAVEVLGKELVSTADSISAALPQRKDRGPDWKLRL